MNGAVSYGIGQRTGTAPLTHLCQLGHIAGGRRTGLLKIQVAGKRPPYAPFLHQHKGNAVR